MSQVRIHIVDDHALFREGLRAVLERQEGLVVEADSGSVTIGVEAALALRPEVVLMDVRFPDSSGIDATQRIVEGAPGVRVIALSMMADDDCIARMLTAGARGYVLKDVSSEDLVAAIRTVAAGGAALTPELAARILDQYRALAGREGRALRSQLTDREVEILQLLSEGLTNALIGGRLGLSEQTIKNALSSLYAKLRVSNRTEAVVLTTRLGIVKGKE
jgi:DNA-binding NarL/FixJ family response regulator